MVTDLTSASIQGAYALAVAGDGGRAPFAALGVLRFDGVGSVSGAFIENRVSESFERRILVDIPYHARYRVTAEGAATITQEGGDQADAYLAIRDVRAGAGIAEEITLVFRELDAGTGCLKTAVGRRLPDGARFTDASLSGRYCGFAVGRGGQMPVAGFGFVTYDGAGAFTETNVANVQGERIQDRRFVNGTDRGRYAVNADGTGTVAAGAVLFAVTKASLAGGIVRADEYSFMVRDLAPGNGAHFTGVARRIFD